MSGYALLTLPAANPKTEKGLAFDVFTFPLHLAPADLSGFEVCSQRSAGCSAACLNTAGRGRFDSVQTARIRKTQLFFTDRAAFLDQLICDISRAMRRAAKLGLTLAIRLNATSDIPWHRIPVPGFACIMNRFPTVQFYDYTKVAKRFRETLPANYHLTFSLCEDNLPAALNVLSIGGNVAVVFRDKATVSRAIDSGFHGFPVYNGDESDIRFRDPAAHWIALYAKGKAKLDRTGFVRDLPADLVSYETAPYGGLIRLSNPVRVF